MMIGKLAPILSLCEQSLSEQQAGECMTWVALSSPGVPFGTQRRAETEGARAFLFVLQRVERLLPWLCQLVSLELDIA